MHDDKVVCPRCGQDWLIHVRLIHLDRNAISCPECEALWHTAADVGVTPFEEYQTFMIRNGRANPNNSDEIEFGAPLMQALN